MRILRTLVFLLLASVAAGCAHRAVQPPTVEARPERLEIHGDVRVDNYYWLRERDNPDVIRYLEQENAYARAKMSGTRRLRNRLFDEIKGRVLQTDVSVPYRLGDYHYYSRYEEGRDYPIYARKRGTLEAEEEVMLDLNDMAEDEGFLAVRGRKVSSGQNLLAYAVDTVGRRIYTIRFKDLDTGETLPDEIPDVTSNMAWANDNRTLFYTKQDPVTLRWHRVYRHVLGTDPSEDVLVYEEKDETFSCHVWKTKSKRFLVIGSEQTLSTEVRYLDADRPEGAFRVFHPRERDHEYDVDHFGDHFYVRTNLDARNFRLMRTPLDATGSDRWEEVIPHREDVLFEGFEVFRNHLVVEERREGLSRIRVRRWDGGEDHGIDFGEPAYLAYVADNPEIDTDTLRYVYSSMTTPKSVYDYEMNTRDRELLKREEVLGGFDPDDYRTERLTAVADDGTRIPVSIVYRKGLELDGSNPLLLYGYGSYGSTLDASFRSPRFSLIDRGFVYAIAHVRGGQELGRAWYDDGKLFNKKNTFTDFIDCAEHLIEQGYTSADRLYAMGGSAGGLLVGAVVNMRPDLFDGVIAAVPFVDVVTTMLDDAIPLTTGEFDEWGDPKDRAYYDYMLSYSPYDNVREQPYPNMLVSTGLHDSQVQYWEPAKWVAKLRATKTDDNLLLLRTDMGAGHGGPSGRFARYRETAYRYAFLLDLAGIRR